MSLYAMQPQCKECDETFDNDTLLFKHIRKQHHLDVRDCAGPSCDKHGHCCYCFECDTRSGKNHRSFDSYSALEQHMSCVHGMLVCFQSG
jgi:hypothetical protein